MLTIEIVSELPDPFWALQKCKHERDEACQPRWTILGFDGLRRRQTRPRGSERTPCQPAHRTQG